MSIYIPHSPYASTTHYKPTQCSNMTPLSSAQSITTYFEKFEKNYQTTSNTRNFNNFIIDIKENTRQLIRGKSVSNSIHCNNPQKRPQTYKVYGTDVKDNKENEENLRRMKEKYLQKSIDRPIVEKYDRKNKEIEYFNFEKYTSPKNQSIKETEYISVEKLLNKDSRQKRADETFIKDLKHRPKSGKSCSTHLLSSQKFNELEAFHSPTYKSSQEKNQSQIYCPNSEKERKNYNIYSQNNIQREKNSKIVSIMKKIEGIQKNFDEHLFYKSLDYSIKSKEDENQTINESKTKQILKESKISENTPIPISNKANIYKKSNSYDIESMKSRPFFEKENESYADKNQLFSRINEKLYGQIINRRLEMQTKYEAAVKNTLTIAKFASFMSQDTPSQACSTPDCFKSENKTKNNSHNSHQFQNLPTKIDKTTFKSIATKNKNPKLSFRIGSLTTNLSIEDFQVGKCLGKGRFGSVFLAKDKRSEILVALKVVKKKTIKDSKMANQIKNEIKIQSCLSHPNVLKFFGFFQDEEQFYLILEYAPQGELYKKMKKQVYIYYYFY